MEVAKKIRIVVADDSTDVLHGISRLTVLDEAPKQ